MDLYFLGPPKTFSHEATLALAGQLTAGQPGTGLLGPEQVAREVCPCPLGSLEAVARATAGQSNGTAEARGVLPYYNLLEGLVQESLDVIYEYRLAISGAYRLPIRFALGGRKRPSGPDPAVYSHPKALAQCSEFLQRHWPQAKLESVASTAAAAQRVQETGEGLAIASLAALRESGLEVFNEDLGNKTHGRANFTDFLLVGPSHAQATAAQAGDHTIVAVTPYSDRIGLLADILTSFRFHGINIVKIHSRPAIDAVPTEFEPQMFYLELNCHAQDLRLHRCSETLRFAFGEVEGQPILIQILGSFPELSSTQVSG